jgi:hypothetical protein
MGESIQKSVIFYTTSKNEVSLDDMAASFMIKFNEYLLHGIKEVLGFMHRILCCVSEIFPFIFEAVSCAHPHIFQQGNFTF